MGNIIKSMSALIFTLAVFALSYRVTAQDNSALASAIAAGDLVEVQRLVQAGADVNAGLPDGRSPLFLAAYMGTDEIVKFLVERGADLDTRVPDEGKTALLVLLEQGRVNCARFLADRGADVTLKTKSGIAALHSLVRGVNSAYNYRGVLREDAGFSVGDAALLLDALLKNGADKNALIESGDYAGFSPFRLAVVLGNPFLVSLLISRGASLEKEIPVWISGERVVIPILIYTLYSEQQVVSRILIERGAAVNESASVGSLAKISPLELAINKGLEDCVLLLIAKGADINAASQSGWWGETTIVDLMIENFEGSFLHRVFLEVSGKQKLNDDLAAAVSAGDAASVKKLLARGADPAAKLWPKGKDDHPDLVLKEAVAKGRRDIVGLFLEALKPEIRAQIASGLIETAVETGDIDMLKLLLRYGKIDPSWPPLALAAALGKTEIVRFLLDQKIDPEFIYQIPTGAGIKTALNAALENGQFQIARLLIAHGSLAREERDLFEAIAAGDLEKVRALVKRGCALNITAPVGLSPLAWASYLRQYEITALLLEAGAKLSLPDVEEALPPLYCAASSGDARIVKLFLEHHADVGVFVDWNWSVLKEAAAKGNLDAVRLLIAAGADYNEESWQYEGVLYVTPAEVAATAGKLDVVRYFLGLKLSKENTLLVAALVNNRSEVARYLLDHGIPATEEDYKTTWTPLHLAARHGNLPMVELLISRGARDEGNRALLDALKTGHLECARFLLAKLQYSADFFRENSGLLFDAIKAENLELLRFILERGVDLETTNNEGKTPLFEAAAAGRDEIIRLLLQSGADYNKVIETDGEARTVLDFAWSWKTWKLLYDAGARYADPLRGVPPPDR
jgi:ankyrin repeat protein